MQRPQGEVTFLFTDIEGSTRLWEAHPQAMKMALARHDSLLRGIFESHGGYIFKTVGDAFFVAFQAPTEGLSAAVAGQRGLVETMWGDLGPLRVRMALNSGVTDERDGDYFGPTLNRVARLLSAGHGGQVLLSQATMDLVRPALYGGLDVRDMGERRLKDLVRPERLYQLLIPNLPTEFPPLKTLDARPNNLPVQPTVLVGREREAEAARQLIRRSDVRLVSLTGPGGIGKTRVALQVAADLVDDFEHGCFFISLANADADLVASTIAQTLDIRESGGRSPLAGLKDALRDKQMLLVLDGFEQVVAAASHIAEMMAAAPHIKFLITSQTLLRVRGEYEVRIPTLGLPPQGRRLSVEGLRQYPAIDLFVQRAEISRPDFELTAENAQAVVEICRRLDGLPLALELAAARVKVLSPQAMLGRLENTLKLLTGGARDLPARQQTLRNAIAWTHDLLDDEEKKAFRRLSVFVGGCSLEAAEGVCNAAGDLERDVLDEVTSLVEKSLLRQEEDGDGDARFVMLRTIREYGREQLESNGEGEDIRRQHALYYETLVTEVEPKLTGKQQSLWLRRLEIEHDNLRVALDWLAENAEDAPVSAWKMAGRLWRFWATRGHFTEGRERLTHLLQQSAWDSGPDTLAARAHALNAAGNLTAQQGDYATTRGLYEESLALRRQLNDKAGIARLLNNLGILARFEGNHATARTLYEESVGLLRQLNDRPAVAQTLNNLALVVRSTDLAQARKLLEESLALRRQLGDKWGIANSLSSLGDVVLDMGDMAAAHKVLRESLQLNEELGDRRALAFVLEDMAGLAATEGKPQHALRLVGAADALRAELNAPLSPDERVTLDRRLAPARAALSEAEGMALWQEGHALSLEGGIEYAIRLAAE